MFLPAPKPNTSNKQSLVQGAVLSKIVPVITAGTDIKDFIVGFEKTACDDVVSLVGMVEQLDRMSQNMNLILSWWGSFDVAVGAQQVAHVANDVMSGIIEQTRSIVVGKIQKDRFHHHIMKFEICISCARPAGAPGLPVFPGAPLQSRAKSCRMMNDLCDDE